MPRKVFTVKEANALIPALREVFRGIGYYKSRIREQGRKIVFLLRLSPAFPFNLLNYALGLTRIPLSHYVVTTFIFMAPGGAAYTYLGYAGREIAVGGEAEVLALGDILLDEAAPLVVDSDPFPNDEGVSVDSTNSMFVSVAPAL